MIQTFTHDDVIRYVYNETTEEESNSIQDGLVYDPEMLAFYLDVLDVKTGLDKSLREPSQRSIDKVLLYSRNANTKHQSEAIF